jgi:predicted ATP-grasp superfamily ATP-dependent carboligase
MKGPGVGVEGRATTVLIFEYVTGGGMAGRALPASWAAEGAAMRRAIVRDFATLPDVRVVTTVDARLPIEEIPGVDVRVFADHDWGWPESLAAGPDYILLIVPEAIRTHKYEVYYVESVGGRLLGSSYRAIDLVGDKYRLAHQLARHQVPTPPTMLIRPNFSGFPDEWYGPILIKPSHGAGSVDTVVVGDRRCPSWVPRDRTFVAQPYLSGEPMSASFLVDVEGHPTLLAIGRQRFDHDEDGRLSYLGGTIPARLDYCPAPVLAAIEAANVSVEGRARSRGLRGFVGVDFLLDEQDRATVLEINPRPTTSYVGLARLFPPGTIAGAWLAAINGPLDQTDWPDRLRLPANTPAVSFDADGTIHPHRRDDAS